MVPAKLSRSAAEYHGTNPWGWGGKAEKSSRRMDVSERRWRFAAILLVAFGSAAAHSGGNESPRFDRM
jgi:hypothetical protein